MKKYLLLSGMLILAACSSNKASEQASSVTSSEAASSEIASSTADLTSEISDTFLQGMMGTYEITSVGEISDYNPDYDYSYINPLTGTYEYSDSENGGGSLSIFGNGYDTSTVKITMNYTNTYFSPVTPKEAVRQDFVIEHEDEVTISTMQTFVPAYTTDEDLKGKTIKVGGTAEIEFTIFVTTSAPNTVTSPGTIYLRNNTGSGINGNLFERVIATIPE